jgi:hypothetical protein
VQAIEVVEKLLQLFGSMWQDEKSVIQQSSLWVACFKAPSLGSSIKKLTMIGEREPIATQVGCSGTVHRRRNK